VEFENFEIYLFFIKAYIERISFSGSEKFVKTIERLNQRMDEERNYILFAKNPIKTCVLLIEVLMIMKRKSQTLQTKIEKEIKDLYNVGLSIQGQIDDEVEMTQIFFEKDLEDREVIKIVSDLNLIKFYDHKIMEKIIISLWEGPYITDGSIFDTMTSYQIMKRSLSSNVDYERETRWKASRSIKDYKNNAFQFIVWRDSLFYRFLISSMVLLAYAVVL